MVGVTQPFFLLNRSVVTLLVCTLAINNLSRTVFEIKKKFRARTSIIFPINRLILEIWFDYDV